MKCQTCEYSLWNIAPGPCPECGTVFDPTQFEFPEGVVRFCCPHCDQAYFGDGPGGHLVPSHFQCVECGGEVEERACTIRPVAGYSDADLEVAKLPWSDPKRSRFRRLIDTIGWSMAKPSDLGREVAREGTMLGGLVFTVLINVFIVMFGIFPFLLLIGGVVVFAAGPAGGGVWGTLLGGLVFMAGLLIFGLVSSLLSLVIHGVVAHAVLRITGSVRGSFGTTLSTMFFASGPVAISAVPVIGPSCLNTVGIVWAIVAGILAIRTAQGVGVGRAIFAGTLAPLLGLAAYIGFFTLVSLNAPMGGRMPPVVAALTAPKSIVVGQGLGMIDPTMLVEEVAEAEALPGVLGTLSSPSVVMTTDVGEISSRRLDGDTFRGWWIPGLLVIKRDDAAIVALMVAQPVPQVEMKLYLGGADGNSLTGAQRRPDNVSGELMASVDRMGGSGRELDKASIDAWVAASLGAIERQEALEDSGSPAGPDSLPAAAEEQEGERDPPDVDGARRGAVSSPSR